MNRYGRVFLFAVVALAILSTPPMAWSQSRPHNDDEYDDRGASPHGRGTGSIPMTASSLKARLGLTDEQADKLRALRRDYLKETVMQTAKVRVAELELNDLLDQDELNASKIEKKVKEMEALRGDLTLSRVRSLLKATDFMTPEQFKKFRAMTVRRMGAAGAHGPTGMMGKAGKSSQSEKSPHGGPAMMPRGPMPGMMNPHQ